MLYYEDASEALHGTKYGCTFHLGVYEPGKRLGGYDDMFEHFRSGSAGMLFLAGALVHELIRLASTLVDVQEVLDMSAENAKAATDLVNKAVDEEKTALRDRTGSQGGWRAGWRKNREPAQPDELGTA